MLKTASGKKNAKRLRVSLGTFDLFKGLGLIIIISTHVQGLFAITATNAELSHWLLLPLELLKYGLMPFFFLVCGYSFKPDKHKLILKKSAKDFLKPYIFVTAAHIVLFPVIHYGFFRGINGALTEGARVVLAFVMGTPEAGKVVLGIPLYENSVLWFVLAMFWAINLTNIVARIENVKKRILVQTVFFLLGALLQNFGINYFCLARGLIYSAVVYVGYCLKKYKVLKRGLNTSSVIAFLTATAIILAGYTTIKYTSLSGFNVDFDKTIGVICPGILIAVIFFYAAILVDDVEGPISEKIRQFGRYTYWGICVHSVEMDCIPWYMFAAKFADHQLIGWIAMAVIRTLIVVAGCVVIERIHRHYLKKKIRKAQ